LAAFSAERVVRAAASARASRRGHARIDADRAGGEAAQEERAAHVRFLRDIFGNPFRPLHVIDPAWLAWDGGTLLKLAQAAYEERRLPDGTLDSARFAILRDALEEAGCDNPDLLGHCREPGEHVRGCWLLDLLRSVA
jgi:hypothetical protein